MRRGRRGGRPFAGKHPLLMNRIPTDEEYETNPNLAALLALMNADEEESTYKPIKAVRECEGRLVVPYADLRVGCRRGVLQNRRRGAPSQWRVRFADTEKVCETDKTKKTGEQNNNKEEDKETKSKLNKLQLSMSFMDIT